MARLFEADRPETNCQLNPLASIAHISETMPVNQVGKWLVIVRIVPIKNSTNKKAKQEANILMNKNITIFKRDEILTTQHCNISWY